MEKSAGLLPVVATIETTDRAEARLEDITRSHISETRGGVQSRLTGRRILNRTSVSFFLMGLLVGLPAMPITTAASAMFGEITGVYGICFSLAAAVSAFAGPMLARYIPYDVSTIVLTLASALAYIICTLPHPLALGHGGNETGPVIGTLLAGFVYAFGSQIYLSVAAFFPNVAIVALSTGSGLSIILGSGIFIALMDRAFDDNWRKCFLVIAPTSLLIPVVWWCLFDTTGRQAAEHSRRRSLQKSHPNWGTNSSPSFNIEKHIIDPLKDKNYEMVEAIKPGFGAQRSRTGLLLKTILPRYILPLIICTTCAILCLFGLAPALQTLHRFPDAPPGDLEFELLFFAYGSAQFIFSALVAVKRVPVIWIWTGIEVALTTIVLLQIWYPFLQHFWGLWAIMFLVGGCVGGSVTNTNHKINKDFKEAGEPDEVRSFANSYAGLGNFGGDAIGGAIGLVIQLVVVKNLQSTP
ncbi:hypothetical protein F4803DRAFT_538728 [Xylaria telfairii]|nr:hypothetical protein F4803DRAFT_538728 [Xylaria telfairii]